MTYGAGKTAVGSNYLSEMRKWAKGDNLDEDQQAALQSLKEQEGLPRPVAGAVRG